MAASILGGVVNFGGHFGHEVISDLLGRRNSSPPGFESWRDATTRDSSGGQVGGGGQGGQNGPGSGSVVGVIGGRRVESLTSSSSSGSGSVSDTGVGVVVALGGGGGGSGNQDEFLMERTNTYVQWPSRMKIGAKTKKDLYIRVYGHNQEEVNDAKNQILTDLGPHRDLRITLKMEISYTDHSHLIGCRGQTIRKVMDDTGCHIHFPDSNRMSKEHKSNQVTIAGSSIASVEQARARVRELSPLVFQFSLPTMHSPYEMQINPEAHHVFIDNIQQTYGVQVTIHPPNKLQQTSVSVKGCEIDSSAVREAVGKIIGYFSGNSSMGSVQVESTMEITPVQHPFVRAVNDSNVHAIMMNTGAKIIFPDLTDGNIQQIKRSRVYISGELNCVYNARQQLIGCLPLRMIFDLADDYHLDWDGMRQVGADMNVNVKLINRNRGGSMERGGSGHSHGGGGGGGGLSSLPPPVPGRSRTIQLIAHERNTSNLFEVRRRILGGVEQPCNAGIPGNYLLRPTYPTGDMKGSLQQYGNRLGPPMGALPPLMLPTSPNMLSPVLSPSFWPPSPFTSPFCSPSIATCIVSNQGQQQQHPHQHQLQHPQHHGNPVYGQTLGGGNMGMMSNGGNMYGNGGAGGGGPGSGRDLSGQGPPPGIGKLTLNLQHGVSYGYNGIPLPSPSPVNMHPPPEISINNLKHSFHLPLLDPHTYSQQQQQQQYQTDSALNTPMSLGGTSTFSDLSPMTMHPGVGMVNALINDFGNMDIRRKAPGCERSNTVPNLYSHMAGGGGLLDGPSCHSVPGSRSGSPTGPGTGTGCEGDVEDTSTSAQSQDQDETGPLGGGGEQGSGSGSSTSEEMTGNDEASKVKVKVIGDKVVHPDPTHDKKYMAVKAMYHSKIGAGVDRVPNSEWSGCGFSKTYLNLFPADNKDKDKGKTTAESGSGEQSTSTTDKDKERDSGHGSEEGWNGEASGSGTAAASNGQIPGRVTLVDVDVETNANGHKEQRTNFSLGPHQQSNLLDFGGPRPGPEPDRPPTDLPSLFIQNGLGKYIDTFISEEIDLDTFSSLNESDLRSLGVTAYPARKRMLVLITQLATPRQFQDWNPALH